MRTAAQGNTGETATMSERPGLHALRECEKQLRGAAIDLGLPLHASHHTHNDPLLLSSATIERGTLVRELLRGLTRHASGTLLW